VWEAQTGPAVDGGLSPEQIFYPDSPARTLLAVISRGLQGRDCDDLGDAGALARFGDGAKALRRGSASRVRADLGPRPDLADRVDAEEVARWVIDQYPRQRFPGALIGSPHGAAAHLATAMGMPWLPAGFEMAVWWPDGSTDDPAGAMRYGARFAHRFLEANPDLTVRQVHDPTVRGALAGCAVSLFARWRSLPDPYRRFLASQLAPGAPILSLRDARTWPVLDAGSRYTFQLGGPTSGLEPGDFVAAGPDLCQVLRRQGGDRARWRPPSESCPEGFAEAGLEPELEEDVRDWAVGHGRRFHRALYARPEVLSASTADVYRQWLRASGKTGNRLVVECGRLLDPAQVVRAGLVPYWCENATRGSVCGAELWLAGSSPFTSVDVLVEAPGVMSSAVAPMPQWRAVASFGTRRGVVDPVSARGYPLGRMPTRHATKVLRGQPYDLPRPAPLRFDAALAGLRDQGRSTGLLVC
jgi:hypothetical protein